MSKETKEKPAVDIIGAFDKTENYIEQNRKSLALIVGGVILLVGIYFGWKYLYLKPKSDEASAKMYKAEMYFAKDSFNLAINGNGDTAGFAEIVKDYGMTKAGNLSKYYLGVCYLRTAQYDKAIESLKDFDSDDMFLSAMSLGLIGDAYMEQGKIDDAIDYYQRCSEKEPE